MFTFMLYSKPQNLFVILLLMFHDAFISF